MTFWRNKPLIVTLILTIVLVVLLFSTSGAEDFGGAGSIISGALVPLQSGLYQSTMSVGGFFERLFAEDDIAIENFELKEKIANLESRLREYDYLSGENERLTELMSLTQLYGNFEFVGARVIGKNPGDWYQEFTIDKGLNQSVERNMIVMTKDGLMGRVVRVAGNYSKVMTIIDSSSGVAALIERTRDNGVVKGNYQSLNTGDNFLTMNHLPLESDVIPGDRVLTSGLGGIFPKGLYIGIVTEVARPEGSTEKIVTVQSSVDFRRLEEVMIIKQIFPETGF